MSDNNEDEFELEIEDDTPEEDRGKPVASAEDQEDVEDDELDQYSDSVKNRIKKLTAQKHDQRRRAEESERLAAVAIQDARETRERLAAVEAKERGKGAKEEAEAEVASLQAALKDAVELGEGDKVADLTLKLQRAASKAERAEQAERFEQQRPKVQEVSSRQKEWNRKNPWFGFDGREDVDEVMTATAVGLHQKLVKKGVAPETEEYYNSIDSEMRKRFPENFTSQKSKQDDEKPAPVSGATRRSASGKQTIRLTQSQVALCAKLGIDPKDYAKNLLSKERN